MLVKDNLLVIRMGVAGLTQWGSSWGRERVCGRGGIRKNCGNLWKNSKSMVQGLAPIDRKIHNILKSAKVRHSMYPKLLGSPDVLVHPDVLVFLDGCFWHCCPKCFRLPKSRLKYWRPKLFGNRRRDVKVSRLLRKLGWKVVRIWEHEIRAKPNAILVRLDKLHSARPVRRLLGIRRSLANAPRPIRQR